MVNGQWPRKTSEECMLSHVTLMNDKPLRDMRFILLFKVFNLQSFVSGSRPNSEVMEVH